MNQNFSELHFADIIEPTIREKENFKVQLFKVMRFKHVCQK